MIFTFPEITKFKDWQARWRKHIRCMVWWEELQKPAPVCKRVYFRASNAEHILFYAWYRAKTEWRKLSNNPMRCRFERFMGDCAIQAPVLELPNGTFKLLDCCHRIRDLEPQLIIGDVIRPKKEDQYCAFASSGGDWARK